MRLQPLPIHWSACVALGLGAFVACDSPSPFEPRGEGERVPIGREIADAVGGDTLARYSFVAESAGVYAIFLAATEGSVLLVVTDSTHRYTAATLAAGPASPALYKNAASVYPVPTAGGVYHITIGAVPAGSAARFRFVVYAVRRAPELLPAAFSFGDTVSGETIDPIVDLDLFVAHGEAGQEIVAVGETPGPPGSGSVSLTVIDPVTKRLLGYVFADAGTANPLTTGRIRLPETGAYEFVLGSVTSNQYPRYGGAYRFWTYLVDPAPEHRAAMIPFDTELAGERIDRAGDVDEWTFQAAANNDFNAFIQGHARTFRVEVARPGGPPLAAATSQTDDTALFARATNRFHITNAGTYVLRVTGTNPYQVADTGAYRVYLYAVDRQPEQVSSAIAPGDTVTGEDIGLPGDVDEFTFSAPAGAEFNAFLQGQNGSPDTHLQVEVVTDAGTVLATARSAGSDTSLLRQVTGRFTLPSAGTYRLRVSGNEGFGERYYRGAYRLFLYRVNREPEAVPNTLVFGDSVFREAIDVPGDVDEFRVTVPDSSGANLAFAFDGQMTEGTLLVVQLLDAATGQRVGEASTYQSAVPVSSGRRRLAAGDYVVRVDVTQYQLRPVIRGPYRLWFYRFGFDPEQVPDTFAIRDTVSGESIEPWGDEDRFHFFGVRNQHINIMAQGLAAPSDGGFQFFVRPPPGATAYGVFINSRTAASALEDHQTARIDLPATGWYTVDVSGASGRASERGPYRFAVLPVDPRPEHVSAALNVGDSVTTESINAPGDLDEFTVAATAGQDVSLIVYGRDGFTGPFIYLWVYDPATFDTLAVQPDQFRRIAGPFRVPASGQFKIDVSQPRGLGGVCYDATCGGTFTFVGPYAFSVITVNRAPESVVAAFTVGDTIRGETISPIGDIDEFTSAGTPGEQLTLFDRLTTTSSLDSALVLEAIDPATGRSLVGGNVAILGSTFYRVGSFTVPPGGTFIVRARVYGEWGYGAGATAPYEFFVQRGP